MKTPLTIKIILFITVILASTNINAQTDSSRLTPTVTLQARDIEYFVNFTKQDVRWDKMDSLFINKLSGSNAPSGTTNVTCDGIQARHWLSFFEHERSNDALYIDQGLFTRFRTALNATSHSWLISRITASDTNAQNMQSDLRTAGRKRARKERDDQ